LIEWKWLRRTDAGLLFSLLMSGFGALPVLAHPGLFVGHDTLNHAFRVGEISRLWSAGLLLPRWAETFYFGYGSPVFQYYAPLTYYLSALFMRLFGLDAVGALRLLVTVCPFIMGAGMYLFMRQQVGKLGGLLAALVYVYSPYLLFTEPVTRGDYPELLSFTLFPLVMWRMECLLRDGRAVNLIFAALLIGVFALAHNLMSALLFALLMSWLIWRRMVGNITWAQLRRGLGGALIGIGLVAFFWLPILLERDEVQLGNVTVNIQSEQENFFGFFVPLNRLLEPSPPTDAGAANGVLLRLNLGLAQWGLALSGLFGLSLLWRKARRAPEQTCCIAPLQNALFFAILAAVMLVAMLPFTSGLWAAVPALNFLEFPWRLLGPIAFCLAVIAGMNALWMERLPVWVGQIVTTVVVAAPVLLALPALYIPQERLTRLDTSPGAYLQSEISGQISPGTSARNDFLPRAVKVLPGATQSLLDDYAEGDTVNKANPLSIPAGNTITLLEHRPQADTWQIDSAAPFTLEIMTFYFAGWTATLDDQPVPIKATQPHGFMRIDVPAGDHTLRLFLSETPARVLGIAVSLAALVGIGLIPIRSRRGGSETLPYNATTAPLRWGALLTGGAIALICLPLLMREGVAWIKSPPGQALVAQHQTVYYLGEEIQVLGYDLSAETVRPGDWLGIVVYWYAKAKPQYNYTSFVHFAAGEMPLAQAGKLLPGGLFTSQWTPGAYRRDEYSVRVPYGIASGEYRINIGLYTCDTRPAGECGNGDRLPVSDADGNALGDILPLATITVR